MPWQRCAAQAARSVEPLDLRTLAGLPGQLSYGEGYSSDRMIHLPCTLRRVDHTELVLELNGTAAPPARESAVILEVLTQQALVQCFTQVRSSAREGTLSVWTPARPHVAQRRRFPRVAVFLSVTLCTADRTAEPVPAQMINLSVDGAACVLSEPLPAGSEVMLNLTSLGVHPPDVNALVRRSTPTPHRLWVIGLQFQAMLPEQELYLTKYVAECAEQNSGE